MRRTIREWEEILEAEQRSEEEPEHYEWSILSSWEEERKDALAILRQVTALAELALPLKQRASHVTVQTAKEWIRKLEEE